MNNSRQVFISYGRDDVGTPFAHELRERIYNIDSHDLSVFLDTFNLEDGEKWYPGLTRNIEDSFLVIVLCSKKANISEYVKFEWAYAMGCKKRIMAIEIQKDKNTPIPPALMEYHSSNMNFLNPSEDDWDALLNTIVDIFEKVFVPNHVERALEFAEHPLKDYREQAIQSLSENEHPQATEALAFLCENSYIPSVKWQAAVKLAKIKKDNRAVPELIKRFETTGNLTNLQTKHRDAIFGLFSIRDEKALSAIADLYISNSMQELKESIINKFRPLKSTVEIPYVKICLQHEDVHPHPHKYELLKLLVKEGDLEILPELENFLLAKARHIPLPNSQSDYTQIIRDMAQYDIDKVLHIYLKVIEAALKVDKSRSTDRQVISIAEEVLKGLENRAEPLLAKKLQKLLENKRETTFVLKVQYVAKKLSVDN